MIIVILEKSSDTCFAPDGVLSVISIPTTVIIIGDTSKRIFTEALIFSSANSEDLALDIIYQPQLGGTQKG